MEAEVDGVVVGHSWDRHGSVGGHGGGGDRACGSGVSGSSGDGIGGLPLSLHSAGVDVPPVEVTNDGALAAIGKTLFNNVGEPGEVRLAGRTVGGDDDEVLPLHADDAVVVRIG